MGVCHSQPQENGAYLLNMLPEGDRDPCVVLLKDSDFDEAGLGWYMRWCALMSFKYGTPLGYRDPESGRLKSVCFAFHPGSIRNGKVHTWSRMISTSFKVSSAPPEDDPKKFGKHAGLRLKGIDKHMSSLHSKHAPGPHWYAYVLATDPSSSRQGAASALVRAILAMCTQAGGGIQLYLECAKDNVPFYRDKLGMRAIGSVVMENPDPEGEEPAECFAMMSELMS